MFDRRAMVSMEKLQVNTSTKENTMTKQLREWTAPDGGETYRWDPTVNYVQRKVGETWVCVYVS